MMYRRIETDESNGDDILVRTYEEDFYIRPVPELKQVDELTDDEWSILLNLFDISWGCSVKGTITRITKKLDELRSRPKETDKERWIREYGSFPYGAVSLIDIKEYIEKTWDAAYKAGKREREEV